MEIKTIQDLKEHIGEQLYACSLYKEALDEPKIIRDGLLCQFNNWCGVNIINKVEDIKSSTIVLIKRDSKSHEMLKCFTWFGKWGRGKNRPFYDQTKIFTTEKELDFYISEYNKKHIKHFINRTKTDIRYLKQDLKAKEKRLAEKIKFAEDNKLI